MDDGMREPLRAIFALAIESVPKLFVALAVERTDSVRTTRLLQRAMR